ncbi:MAG: glycosyltransferase family 4 protein [Candidatus Cloacimonetes bacterium]|nr:glycosyltransferase family 4 protein [Candidatus Cloacimonadota bacterium]
MIKRKKIWCISKYASPPKYGVGARLFYVAREFSKLDLDVLLVSSNSNHLACYPASEKTFNFEEYDNLKHLWIKTLKYTKSASMKRIMSWIDFEFKLFRIHKILPEKPDIVIISSLSMFSILYGLFLKKKFKCKLIFEVRDIYPLTLTEEFKFGRFNPLVLLLGFLEKIAYNKSDLIVGTMPNLVEHVNLICKKEKNVYFSPIGIHELWLKDKTQNPYVDSLFPSESRFIVGYAGSIGTTNAMNSFIEAIKYMAEEKEVYFVIVGDGDLKKNYIEKLSGLANVKIGEKISQNDIPYFLSKCDLLYLSTHDSKIWKYGQSLNKLVDYMMSEKPVIASFNGYESMLNQANSGLFLPINDVEAIINAINKFKDMSEIERKAYGSRGKKWIEENRNYKTISQNYYAKIMDLYNEK